MRRRNATRQEAEVPVALRAPSLRSAASRQDVPWVDAGAVPSRARSTV
jgi:hypothetical protein